MPDSARAEEPGGWELRRALSEAREDTRAGFAQLNDRLDKLVSEGTFTAEQRRVDERFKDLADRVAAERAQREAGDKAQQVTLDKLVTNIRWLGASIVLPVALFVANLIARRGA